ncbi:protein TPRXL [Nocardioides sp.]|uniref:protein TPRXL n=1 Tax=Nocardioides sp. TaxID=35761 RepID=UPI00198A7273|nr:protein TPRXL [Nocardioides sp.]MBC7278228.1 protein TPRXL [Nocardioides sp.]
MSVESGSSLREMLGAAKDPDFSLKLLPGWERHTPNSADRAAIDEALRRRMMAANRPDLHAALKVHLDQTFRSMQEQGVIAYFAATSEAEGEGRAYVPGSIVATIRRSPAGESLDAYVADAIRNLGATPLFQDKRFIRFERESTKTVEGEPVEVSTICYITPVPGSNRRRGLQLTASLARPPEMKATDEMFVGWKMALDVCVSTLRWERPAG